MNRLIYLLHERAENTFCNAQIAQIRRIMISCGQRQCSPRIGCNCHGHIKQALKNMEIYIKLDRQVTAANSHNTCRAFGSDNKRQQDNRDDRDSEPSESKGISRRESTSAAIDKHCIMSCTTSTLSHYSREPLQIHPPRQCRCQQSK